MKDAKLKSALADYVQANPILSSLSGAAVATVFIYPLLILLTGIFHVSGLSQLNSLAMYLFWGSVVLLYAGNNGMFLTIGLGIQALMELISLFVMLFSYGSYFSVNALVEVLVTGTLAFLAFRGFSQTAEFAQMQRPGPGEGGPARCGAAGGRGAGSGPGRSRSGGSDCARGCDFLRQLRRFQQAGRGFLQELRETSGHAQGGAGAERRRRRTYGLVFELPLRWYT